jgi:hypothetical protein
MVGWAFGILHFGSCCYALLCGGKPERQVAVMLLVAAFATAFVAYAFPQPSGSVRWPVMLVDFTLAIGLIHVALTANRLWPMVVSALQLITAIAHPALELAETTAPEAYLAAIFLSGFLIPPVLAFGTFLHRRRTAPTRPSSF